MKVHIGRASRQSAEYCELGYQARRRLKDRTVESFESVSAQLGENIELPRRIKVIFDDGTRYEEHEARVPSATAQADGVVRIMPKLFGAYLERKSFVDGVTGHELSHISDWHTGNLKTNRTYLEKILTEGKAKHVEFKIAGREVSKKAGYGIDPVDPDIMDPIILKSGTPPSFFGRAVRVARRIFNHPAPPLDAPLPVADHYKVYVVGFHLVEHALAETGTTILELHPRSNAEITEAAIEHIRTARQ